MDPDLQADARDLDLRSEMDIETVTEDLSATLETAISPTTVGLWLRETGP
jgi:hypothetical protein